ncbi:CAZyme family GH13 [Penicillium brevicompactum]|uniref:alpha-amylase n=1 Tax=Penicillium brevicompactum TaxID=5074 RepID=A0A9W9RCV1_PENBR|nr:CAZyme family GH13 [Penicillium brevicompactum]
MMSSWSLRRWAGLCTLTGLIVSTSAAGVADWKSRAIYQTMTDRFARTDGSTTAPCNTTAGLFCGGTWRGTIDKLDYIQGMGFDALMISPIVENVEGRVEYGEAYHGYWSSNLDNINSHFGTHQDLLDLGAALRERGMYLMLDTVVNNMASITNGSSPATHIDYSKLTPFNNADYYHDYCKITDWDNMTNAQICQTGDNIVALPDLYTEHKEVQDALIKWAKKSIDTYSIDGLRIDAAKHVNAEFLPAFSKGLDNIFMTGEVLVGSIDTIADYQRNYIGSMPNYPVYYGIRDALLLGNTSQLALAVENSRISLPDVNAMTIFSENHDQPRVAGQVKDISIAKNVLVFTMLFDGIPLIYQGQEQHLDGNGTPKQREAIWLTKYNTDAVLYKLTATLNKIRKHAYILSRDYLELPTHTIYQDSSVLAFTKGVEGRQVVMVLSSQPSTSTYYTIRLPYSYNAGVELLDVLNCKNYTVDNNGLLEVDMDKGEPRVFFPTEYMDGSGLCGFAASNASLASIKTGKDITSYSSVGTKNLGSAALISFLAAVMSYVMIL